MINRKFQGDKIRWNQGRAVRTRCQVPLLVTLLSGIAQAQDSAMVSLAKKLAPHEGLLTKGCIGLLVAFVALVAWEVMEQKRASRSSLDIAKLAAAAAKKKSSATAPASGALPGSKGAPAARSFAPPPPPPPPRTQESASEAPADGAPPPPPPPAADNPFAPAAASSESMGGVEAVDSTVAFTPADAGGSGGWADLLQRVRAGEPEAASFGDTPPPSTEQEASAAMPASPFGAPPQAAAQAPGPADFSAPEAPAFAAPSPAAEPSASSEAWEALLKRTTDGSDSMDAPPTQDSGRIAMGSVPSMAEGNAPAPMASIDPSAGFSLPSGESQPVSGSGEGFQLPGAPAIGSSPPPPPPPQAPQSPFSLPGSGGAADAAPSFKLPGGDAAPAAAAGGGFQLPGQGAPGIDDPSSTLPLSDMFSGGAPGAPPSFQLPSIGSQSDGGANPFDFSGGGQGYDPNAGRTISLDFSQGTGQVPPPPQPKTEG